MADANPKPYFTSTVSIEIVGPNRAQVETLARKFKRTINTQTNKELRTDFVKAKNVLFTLRFYDKAKPC